MEPKHSKKHAGVTWRAIIVSLILIPINGYWIFMSEIIRYQGHPTTISLFYNSIFSLVILILINAILKRKAPQWVFSQSELITIYVMLNIGSALIGHDSIQILVSLMPYTAYFATKENNWNQLFANDLPEWLIVKDEVSVKHFYTGGNLYDPANFGPWLVPVLWWSAFIIVLGLMFLCLNVLLRKQWTEREKLSYPLVQLPLDMTAEGAPLFRDKIFWYGFVIVAALDIVQGLSQLYPSIPHLNIKMGDQSMLFTTKPWNNIGTFPIQFYPFGIGLGMLLPVDLLFSCWFFFWIWKAQLILTSYFGLNTIPNMPFTNEQSLGAYMGICLFSIMVSRKHFIGLFKHFLGMKSDIDDRGEPIPYKVAIWALILGCAFLAGFAHKAGMSGWLIIVFFAIFFAMSIAITRMRVELGPPAHDLHAAGPDSIIPGLLGPKELGTQNLNVCSVFFWFNRAYRAHQMPFQLEGFKMAERTRTSYRGLFVAIAIATVFGTFVAFWIILHLLYKYGAGSSTLGPPNVALVYGIEPWYRMDAWMKMPLPGDINRAIAIGTGFAITLILNSLRMRLGWFPFHPVGYAVSSSWAMQLLWMPMLIAWILKLTILRYGGLGLYRRALPFFLGVILAECVVGSLWTIFGIVFNVTSYAFWP